MKRCVFTLVAACALISLATLSMAAERLNGRVNSYGQPAGGQCASCGQGANCSQGVNCESNCGCNADCGRKGCGCNECCDECQQSGGRMHTSCLHCRRGFAWDGRCDQTSYLPENFKYFGYPVQLGADAFTYWRRPMCAEEKYGYSTPGFNFYTVRGTFDPSTGLGGAETHCPTQHTVSQRPAASLSR